MSKVVINIKTDLKTKEQAKKIASELGLTLSSVINVQLKQFVKSKSIFCSLNHEIPTQKLLFDLKQAEKDYKAKEFYSFDSVDDSIRFLERVKDEN
jgi:addiction module RelB/DinJ family antitoxin